MEDVRTVFVDMDALNALGVDVARNVGALIHDQHGFAVGLGLMGEDGTVQAGADYQIIIFHTTGVPLFLKVTGILCGNGIAGLTPLSKNG